MDFVYVVKVLYFFRVDNSLVFYFWFFDIESGVVVGWERLMLVYDGFMYVRDDFRMFVGDVGGFGVVF